MAQFQLKLFAAKSLADNQWAEKTYQVFDDSGFTPHLFGEYEPARQAWEEKDGFRKSWQQQAKHYFGQILIHRKSPISFLGDISFQFGPNRKLDNKPPHHSLSLYQIDETQLVGDEQDKFLELCDRLFVALDMDYGFLCLNDEYDQRNVVRNTQHPDGSVEPRRIIGMKWPYCLPGLYWINYFGRRYLEQGFAQQAMANYTSGMVKIGNGIRVQSGSSPRYFESLREQENWLKLREMLGGSWFFDPAAEHECHALDVLLDELRSPL
jgi:hypothetical protein